MQTLNFLAKQGSEVSSTEAQLVSKQVQCLGLILTPGEQKLSPDRVRPMTQLLSATQCQVHIYLRA